MPKTPAIAGSSASTRCEGAVSSPGAAWRIAWYLTVWAGLVREHRLENLEGRMHATLRSLLTVALCLMFAAAASAGQLERRLLTAKSYPGSRDRQYQVFIPT